MVLVSDSDSDRVPVLRWVRPPQQARSQKTLDRLLDAAEALVAEKGFDDTPVAEIARRAESSVGAFYSRFADKDALLGALSERFISQALATADDALAPARWQRATIDEIAQAVVRFLVEIHRERRGLLRAFALRAPVDPAFLARRERLAQHIAAGLSALLIAHRGEIRHADPQRAAAFALTMVFGTLEHTILFSEMRSGALAWTDDDLATELARAFLAYLVVPQRPA
jgi:AcrR family transcriptional regulator